MMRVGFSFLTVLVVASLAVIFATAMTAPLMSLPPIPAQIRQFLTDQIRIDVAALFAGFGFRFKEQGRVRCWVR